MLKHTTYVCPTSIQPADRSARAVWTPFRNCPARRTGDALPSISPPRGCQRGGGGPVDPDCSPGSWRSCPWWESDWDGGPCSGFSHARRMDGPGTGSAGDRTLAGAMDGGLWLAHFRSRPRSALRLRVHRLRNAPARSQYATEPIPQSALDMQESESSSRAT